MREIIIEIKMDKIIVVLKMNLKKCQKSMRLTNTMDKISQKMPKIFQNFAQVNKKYIYTMYIYSIRANMQEMMQYPMVILWVSYGYPMVRIGLSTDFRGRKGVTKPEKG